MHTSISCSHWGVPVLLLLALVSAPSSGAGAECGETDIIIESCPDGMNNSRYREVEGPWEEGKLPVDLVKSTAAGLTPSGKCGVRKVIFYIMDKPGLVPTNAAARFYPQVSSKGRYHAYLTWSAVANVTPVYTTVRHEGGEKQFTLAQEGRGASGERRNNNKWIDLGAYEFSPGDEHYVEIRIGRDAKPPLRQFRGHLIADAARFTSKPLRADVIPAEMATAVGAAGSGAPPRAAASASDSASASARTQAGEAELPAAAPVPAAAPTSAATPRRGSAGAPGAGALKWRSSLEEASKEAAVSRKKILLYFELPGSDVSSRLDKVFADKAVRSKIEAEYIPARLDMAKDSQLAAKLGVYRAGTVIVYRSNGTPMGDIRNPKDATEFLKRLDDVAEE